MTDTSNTKKFRINPNYAGDSVRVDFSFLLHPTAKGMFSRPLREEGVLWGALSDEQRGIVRLLTLEGVTKVLIDPYKVWVEMAPLFDRSELTALLRERFIGFGAQEVTKETEVEPPTN